MLCLNIYMRAADRSEVALTGVCRMLGSDFQFSPFLSKDSYLWSRLSGHLPHPLFFKTQAALKLTILLTTVAWLWEMSL